MKKVLWMLSIISMLHAGDMIRIAVAANMNYAIKEIVSTYKMKYPNQDVRINVGSSGKLAAQIAHGAPYDIFLSADMHFPQKLYEKGFAVTKPVVYAQGGLVLICSKEQNLSEGLVLLTKNKIKKIAVANPKTAPYGVAAKEALQNAKLYELLKPKFVYGESISQTLTYALKAADIGIVAKSALFTPQMQYLKEGNNWKEINATYYKPISQGMLVLKSASYRPNEKREISPNIKSFYDFILGDEAKQILDHYGYRLP